MAADFLQQSGIDIDDEPQPQATSSAGVQHLTASYGAPQPVPLARPHAQHAVSRLGFNQHRDQPGRQTLPQGEPCWLSPERDPSARRPGKPCC